MDFKTLQQLNESISSQFSLQKCHQMFLQKFERDWNEYVEINEIKDVKDKDKLLVVIMNMPVEERKRENTKVLNL